MTVHKLLTFSACQPPLRVEPCGCIGKWAPHPSFTPSSYTNAARATVSAGWAYATGSPISELVSQRPLARNTSEEQCLNLNVFTPGLDNAKRPVMVWIHGGAFTFGAGSEPLYYGGKLALQHDVVVVTINYRLGCFGFLPVPGGGDANCGLWDQVEALRWVRAEIAAFGGDPANVSSHTRPHTKPENPLVVPLMPSSIRPPG